MSKIKIIISLVFIICVTVFIVKFFNSTHPKTSTSTSSKNTINILYQATRLGSTMQNSCSYAPYGGLMREINASKAFRSSLQGSLLYIDAGNSLIPFNRDKKLAEIPEKKEVEVAGWIAKELSQANLDVLGLGQIDLNLSIPTLQKIQKESSINFVSSNVQTKKGSYPFPRYLIKESDGVNFGIISISSNKNVVDKNIKIQDPLTALKELVPALKKQGVNFIILLAQMKVGELENILSSLPQDIKVEVAIVADIDFSTSKIFWINKGQTLLANQDFFGAYIGKLEINYDSLPITVFSSPKQLQANKDRIAQLESQLTVAKNPTHIKKELEYLKSNTQLDIPEGASTYDGGIIGLDSSFNSMDTIDLTKVRLINY